MFIYGCEGGKGKRQQKTAIQESINHPLTRFLLLCHTHNTSHTPHTCHHKEYIHFYIFDENFITLTHLFDIQNENISRFHKYSLFFIEGVLKKKHSRP